MTSLSQLIRINWIKAFRRRTRGVTEVCDCLQLCLVSLTSLKSNEKTPTVCPHLALFSSRSKITHTDVWLLRIRVVFLSCRLWRVAPHCSGLGGSRPSLMWQEVAPSMPKLLSFSLCGVCVPGCCLPPPLGSSSRPGLGSSPSISDQTLQALSSPWTSALPPYPGLAGGHRDDGLPASLRV